MNKKRINKIIKKKIKKRRKQMFTICIKSIIYITSRHSEATYEQKKKKKYNEV